MRHPILDEKQSAWMQQNGINPDGVFVVHDGGDYLMVQNYKTGDEILIRRNVMKKKEVVS